MNLKEQKKLLRRQMRERAAMLDKAWCKEADIKIFHYITELPEYQKADCIFCFVGTATEINTAPIIEDALRKGKIVGVPRCVGKGRMDVCRIKGMEDLRLGFYGILEPSEEAPVIPSDELNLAVVPCLSCTLGGVRLGYGGGYYDRYLKDIRAFKAVICRTRMMREDIPREEHDVGMDAVVSEEGVIRLEQNLCDRSTP